MARGRLTNEQIHEELEEHKRALAWAIQNSSDSPNDYFAWLGTWARAGYKSAARNMLYGFCASYDRREPIPDAILEYLYLAFNRYLAVQSDVPLEKALGLTAPAHRKAGALNKKGVEDREPIQILAYVYLLMERDSKTKQDALHLAADRFRISTRQIERYDKDFDNVGNLSGEELERLAKPNAPTPSDI